MSTPIPFSKDDAVAFIRRVRFAHLATRGLESGANIRPLEIDTVYGRDLYFCTYDTAEKVQEIADDPHVAVVWTDLESWSQLRMRATAQLEEDAGTIARFRAENPLVSQVLPPGADDLFTLYRITPDYVQMAEGVTPYAHVPW